MIPSAEIEQTATFGIPSIVYKYRYQRERKSGFFSLSVEILFRKKTASLRYYFRYRLENRSIEWTSVRRIAKKLL